MEDNKAEVVKPNALSGLVEMKISQSDLLNYVVQTQIEKIENELAPIKEELENVSKECDNFLIQYEKELVELAKKEYKSVLKSLEKLNDEFDLYFTFCNVLSRKEFYQNSKETTHKKVHLIAVKKGSSVNYRGDGQIIYDRYSIADAMEDSIFHLQYSVNSELNDKKNKSFNELKEKKEAIQKRVNTLENEIYKVKENSGKMNAKIVKNFLEQTEEGKALIANLGTLTFDSKKLLG